MARAAREAVGGCCCAPPPPHRTNTDTRTRTPCTPPHPPLPHLPPPLRSANVAMKVNAKLGGCNVKLADPPPTALPVLSNRPFMILGGWVAGGGGGCVCGGGGACVW